MTQDIPFRIALAVVFVFTMGVTVYHRLQAGRSGDKISYREEGIPFAIVLRLAGLCLWLSNFAYLIYPPLVGWAAVPLPEALRWVGLATGLPCALLMYWTLASLGKNLTDTVYVRSQATLVTQGPYRWVRHPFYVTAALLMLSAFLLSANALIAGSALLTLALLALRTPKEEQMLIERFGQDYRDYMARTGRYLPRLSRG